MRFLETVMPTIEIDGQTIHYLTGVSGVARERRTIVFVHGAGGNALMWRGQIRGLDRGVNTICPDLPGHGGSPGRGFDSIKAYSHWLLKFVKDLGLNKVILAGHSMGSAVVIETAIQAPEISEALVLVGSGARLRVRPALLQGLESDFEATVREVTEQCYGSGSSEDMIKSGAEQMLGERPEVVLNDFKACDQFDRMDRIGSIKHPAMVICGEEDSMTPTKYTRYLAENLQRATVRIIEGAGHMVMLENTFKVNAAILKFLARL
jgi:pimeloyl-ACP methyl ester carboxylesterase